MSLFADAQEHIAFRPDRLKASALLTALGIVYGDIGTSPLYVFQTISKSLGGHFDETSALGSLSLIVWTLIVVVSVKYCLLVMRADNRGEGGILALVSLTRVSWRGRNRYLLAFGLIGAALIYGDGVITPAISVLSAVEGLKVANDAFAPYTMPIAAAILMLLFVVQRFGTAVVGKAFGPLMLIWFVVIAILGILGIIRQPHVIGAIDPRYALMFLVHNGFSSLLILGGVFLCVTGAEAMYADMGHMGRKPIRVAWFGLVFPALLLNYAGQTAVALENSGGSANPFFDLTPGWALYPMVILSTLATIIASQAIITGSFSLTRQAMQLGWLPGMHIDQTSSDEYGQIYVPFVNWSMMLGTLALTVIFASSDRLSGAYGAAVSTTMLMTTAILYRVMRVAWRWSVRTSLAVFLIFIVVDIAFFAANLLKVADGGWIPLAIGGLIFMVMTTWRTGTDTMHRIRERDTVTIRHFVRELDESKVKRVPGAAVFLTRLSGSVPPLIADHLRQMGTLYKDIVALTVHFVDRPRIDADRRVQCEQLAQGFWHITVRFGFVEVTNVPKALRNAKPQCPFEPDNSIYFSERDRVVERRRKPRMSGWRRHLFSFLYRNSIHPADRFALPPENFVQVSRPIEI